MNENRRCLVGHDDGDAAGALIGFAIGVMIVVAVVMTIVALMVTAGAFIGGFHSLKNYFLAFKHNVIDSNRKPARAR